MLLHTRYLKMAKTGILSVHPWCGMDYPCTRNHTQPWSLVLMVPGGIQSTKDVLVRLFCAIWKVNINTLIAISMSGLLSSYTLRMHHICNKTSTFSSPFSRTFSLKHPWCPPTLRRRKLLFIVFPLGKTRRADSPLASSQHWTSICSLFFQYDEGRESSQAAGSDHTNVW